MQMKIGENRFKTLFEHYPELRGCEDSIRAFCRELVALFSEGGTLYCCGNGGSAADCDHICGELLKGFMSKRPLPEEKKRAFEQFGASGHLLASELQCGLRAVSLLSHPGFNSAFANDVNPDLIFAQQILAQSHPGDILLGISTGGGAKNVMYALMTARTIGLKTVLLTGNKHGVCEKYADLTIAVPEKETYRIQELHLPVYHAVCQTVEDTMFGVSK